MGKNEHGGLTARQIINRYKKGVYVDACADDISAAVSASNAGYASVAIPIQKSWLEEVLVNVPLCFQLTKEPERADEILADISDERARSLLLDLSSPELWDAIINRCWYSATVRRLGLTGKYQQRYADKIIGDIAYREKERLKSCGIHYLNLERALHFIVVEPKD